MEEEKLLQEWIDRYGSIVFFGGAGVSTESGIPDFRSVDGIYNQEYDWLVLDAEPNEAHRKLAELERAGKLQAVVTQNIDGLHQKAGSRKVYELHGSIHRNYCMKCRRFYTGEELQKTEGIPLCSCGGTIKPDVVLYEEGLDSGTMRGAIEAIARADLLIVGGTSLAVYPAAGLLDYFRGEKIVLINKGATSLDRRADLLIQQPIGQVLGRIQVR